MFVVNCQKLVDLNVFGRQYALRFHGRKPSALWGMFRQPGLLEIAGGLDAPCDYSRDGEAIGPIKRSNTRLRLIVCARTQHRGAHWNQPTRITFTKQFGIPGCRCRERLVFIELPNCKSERPNYHNERLRIWSAGV